MYSSSDKGKKSVKNFSASFFPTIAGTMISIKLKLSLTNCYLDLGCQRMHLTQTARRRTVPTSGKSVMKWKLLKGSHGQAQSWAHLCTSTRISPQSLVKHLYAESLVQDNTPKLPVPGWKGKSLHERERILALDRNPWYLLSQNCLPHSPCLAVMWWEAAIIHQGKSCLWDTTLTCHCFPSS